MLSKAKRTVNEHFLSIVVYLLILIALGLTLFSFLKFCTTACAHTQSYRLLGMPFELFGFLFFGGLGVLYLALPSGNGQLLLPSLSFSALGAEVWFSWLQYLEGKVCPVCLLIALTVVLLSPVLVRAANKRGVNMGKKMQTALYVLSLFAGFFLSFFGVSNVSASAAEKQLEAITQNLSFGNTSSPIKIYIFTDWVCPSCAASEEEFKKITKKFSSEASIYFIDLPVHPETVNYTPYHLAFLIHNKPQYFTLRNALHKLSHKVKAPSDEDIEKAIASTSVKLKELSYSEITQAVRFFTETADTFHVSATPSIVVYNSNKKKKKVLVGRREMSLENLQKAFDNTK